MRKIRYKPSKVLIYSMYIIAIITTAFLAFIFQKKVINDIILASVSYVESESNSLKVFYKENNFYEENYITPGDNNENSFVTSYIDYIELNYNYIANFTEHVTGNYKYYIKGNLIVYDPDDKDTIFLKQNYDLTEETPIKVNDTGSYLVNEKYKFDFPKYLNEYEEYKKKDPSLISHAKFIVTMYIVSSMESNGVDEFNIESSMEYIIPLSESAFKIETKDNIQKEAKSVDNILSNETKRVYVKAVSLICWVFTGILGIKFGLRYLNDQNSKNVYEKTLKKILNTYDSVIVNVSSMQNIDDLSIVNVDTFEELVDAQSEVRLPINFKENKENHSATFVLVRNNMAWVYVLRESDLENE